MRIKEPINILDTNSIERGSTVFKVCHKSLWYKELNNHIKYRKPLHTKSL